MARTIISGTVTHSTSSASNAVNSRSAAAERMFQLNVMTNALMLGTHEMRSLGENFLPKWPEEEQASYDDRLARSTLFPAYRRTVVTLSARPFSKPITLQDDVPKAFEPWLENIDLQGNNLDVFVADIFQSAMGDGMAGILVEYPKRPENANTVADEKALALRPYFVKVLSKNILGWRTFNEGGSIKLSQLRLLEEVEEDDGEFGVKVVQQVRVLERGSWKTYRANSDKTKAWDLHDSGTTSTKEIPFVPVFGERIGFMEARPPLLELAHLNVKHWQQQSDQDNLMHVARVPILTVKGIDDKFKLTIGSSQAVNLGEDPGADMKYVEHSGAAIDSGKVQLDDLKEEMRQSGAELLVLKPSPSTATEVASDNAVGMCALQELTAGCEDAVDIALQFMAEYSKQATGGHCELFKDFGAATLAEASYQILVGMATTGKLSDETLINEGKRRGIIAAEVTYENEKEKLEAQGPTPGEMALMEMAGKGVEVEQDENGRPFGKPPAKFAAGPKGPGTLHKKVSPKAKK